jgi:DNA-directed RNA polymerase specialized sigma24 family protein
MDREAEFRRLYEAHRAAVHAYFTGRTGDPQSAADLMQDVFLRAWQHMGKLTDMPDDRQPEVASVKRGVKHTPCSLFSSGVRGAHAWDSHGYRSVSLAA